MTHSLSNTFYREYDLTRARARASPKEPAAHQREALGKLRAWFDAPHTLKGGMLVLPTGGGKTFTATRFLSSVALSKGYKVLWLAHTHHLLEQAFYSFGPPPGRDADGYEVGHVTGKAQLRVRVVSGTLGHGRAHDVKGKDDVVIATLQTIARAYGDARLRGLRDFVASANGKLLVVFDEAHHAPARSYRRLLEALRADAPNVTLLGLTATPTYANARSQGWLAKLFPQGIVYQVSAARLMAQRVLAKPVLHEVSTKVTPTFDDATFRAWAGSYRDLPESVVEDLAKNRERTALIADTYAQHRERWGQTIIFADRWYQCEQLRALLEARGVRAGAVYSSVDGRSSAAERAERTHSDTHATLDAFRRGELDVLINIRMLTEGTDVPNVQSVFLTRATTSRILLTQMIGRALRGPAFGGTSEAHIVSFVDAWEHAMPWATWDDFTESDTVDDERATAARPPLTLVSAALVAQLARDLDTPGQGSAAFVSRLPVGWYRVDFDALSSEDDVEAVSNVLMVFEHERAAFEAHIAWLLTQDLQRFEDAALPEGALEEARAWRERFFEGDVDAPDALAAVLSVARHVAQQGEAPRFFAFDARDAHDLDALASDLSFELELPTMRLFKQLRSEYARTDRLWRALFPTFELFKAQYDARVNARLAQLEYGDEPLYTAPAYVTPDVLASEPDDGVKTQVKVRDGWRCLCCGEDRRGLLQVDHVLPRHYGGSHALENLQTLCRTCNRDKAISDVDFRHHRTTLSAPPRTFTLPKAPRDVDADMWARYLRRAVNFFYQCQAVAKVHVPKRSGSMTMWTVELYEGHDPTWFEKYAEQIVQFANEVRVSANRHPLQALRVRVFGVPEMAMPSNVVAALVADIAAEVRAKASQQVMYDAGAFWVRFEPGKAANLEAVSSALAARGLSVEQKVHPKRGSVVIVTFTGVPGNARGARRA
ncbi:DEAD/DEAH box helicase family protein [Deinococcus yavapaiensis]|uniref:Superfamily II DNA or RNA helicase n=1 Tax=Deinococcus yavapaiensis KR-236 TaxID=694435 RepID=A0A318S8N2_9DEIO|nr:DEAD/DEAH box helicase family protein [Deinococcus yavapaiensis]PYE51992.1 superfamily II DNA or RNA helicase [Deinococcus yavapaiensis KR-236]